MIGRTQAVGTTLLPCVDCQSGSKQVKTLSQDHKFLWENFEALAEEDHRLVLWRELLVSGHVEVKVYVPPVLRKRVISLCHDTVTSGHFYFWKTLSLAKHYFVWRRMRQDIATYGKGCHIWATRKSTGPMQRATMRRYDHGMPMEEICIDLKGP